MRALIIGGGVAGTVTAIALKKIGWDPIVHEQYDHAADGIGSIITMAANGLDALQPLDVKPMVVARGIDTPSMVFFNGRGRRLGSAPVGGTHSDGTVSQTMMRSDLYTVLRDEALARGVQVEYGKRLLGAVAGEHAVRAEFEDGSHADGDVLIGADGLRSRVRKIIDPEAPAARYVPGLHTFGVSEGVSADGAVGQWQMYLGKLTSYGQLKAPDGKVWWFATPLGMDELRSKECTLMTGEQWRDELIRQVGVDRSPAVEVIEAGTTITRPIWTYDFPTVPNWHSDRMVIIGDAAHAASPAGGQGASMAVEDAVTLARCLRDIDDVDAAFRAYEKGRRARVEAVVAEGEKMGDNSQLGPFGRLLRDTIMSHFLKKGEKAMAKGRAPGEPLPMQWMWDHHIDWDEQATA